ncbi:MAG: inositol monophosphatase [Candidatus Buchananbacteria bacterium]|nr:inositol monophosphatase [Candidatus Buchananbacteria bacterium]
MSLKTTAIIAAKKAGKELLKLSDEKIKYRLKKKHDILAEADLKSEKIIINEIRKHYPAHSILSEEMGQDLNTSNYLWVIDPVDGTINFSRQLNDYCISIAVAKKNELILGLIYNPVTQEMFIAEKNKGAFLNGKKLKVSNENKTINMLLATDNSSNPQIRKNNYRILQKVCTDFRHIRIFGSGALHLAKVASGKIDAYYKTKFNYWDYAAGVLLVQEAGGKATDLNGNNITTKSKSIIASNGKIHQQIIRILKK